MFEKMCDMLVENLSLERDDIKMESTFEELEVDSLDLFELVGDLEEEFEIEIEDVSSLKSIEDVVKYVESKTN
ncbi:MAG: acyl carrier protein [Intestinibacter sp.]